MKRQRLFTNQIANKPRNPDAMPGPYVLGWKPNSAQKRLLDRYEKNELRDGASQAEARRRRLDATATFERDATWGTPWEQEIRAAIYADPRALEYLRFFNDGPGAEWATIIRISMWAHAGDKHPSSSELQREFLVPHDQVLSYLRERVRTGVTHSELVKKWSSYATHFSELQRRGFEIEATRTRVALRKDEFRFFLKREPKRHKVEKRHEQYAQIARAIEILGKPSPFLQAWRDARIMARSIKLSERRVDQNPLAYRFKGLIEDDILRIAGHHLKRMTYLMAVAQKTVWRSPKSVNDLRYSLFERLNKRVQRLAPK